MANAQRVVVSFSFFCWVRDRGPWGRCVEWTAKFNEKQVPVVQTCWARGKRGCSFSSTSVIATFRANRDNLTCRYSASVSVCWHLAPRVSDASCCVDAHRKPSGWNELEGLETIPTQFSWTVVFTLYPSPPTPRFKYTLFIGLINNIDGMHHMVVVEHGFCRSVDGKKQKKKNESRNLWSCHVVISTEKGILKIDQD